MTLLRHVPRIKRLLDDENGAEIVEYGLTIGLIAIAAVTGLQAAGFTNGNNWSWIASKVGTALGGTQGLGLGTATP